MELIVSNVNEYQKIFPTCKYSYNESWFHELNKAKVDEIKYFLFKTKKYKMGIVAGIKDNIMKFPYSAPFCIFEKKNVEVSLEELEQTINCLEEYLRTGNLNLITSNGDARNQIKNLSMNEIRQYLNDVKYKR